MNRAETARCYALVTAGYHQTPSEGVLAGWFALLGDLDAQEAYAATLHLCRTSKYPPRPAEIREVVESAKGEVAPDVEAALGYFMAGEWSVHPAIEAAAKGVYWDRLMAPDKAEFAFRALYKRALDREMTGQRQAAIGDPAGEATPIGEVLGRMAPPAVEP